MRSHDEGRLQRRLKCQGLTEAELAVGSSGGDLKATSVQHSIFTSRVCVCVRVRLLVSSVHRFVQANLGQGGEDPYIVGSCA